MPALAQAPPTPSPFDYDSAPVERIDCGDAVLALRRYGSGPALLLVHGFPLSGYTWRHLLPALAQQHTCYVPDLAGFGDSQWHEDTAFNFYDHARRLKTLVNHLGLERYSLMAQDTGATMARCLALIDGARVERMVLFNTEIPGHRPPWIPFYQWLVRWLPGAGLGFRVLMRSRAFLRSGMGFGGCFNNLALIDGDFHARFVAPLITSAPRTAGMTRYLGGLYWDAVDQLRHRHAELRMPVLLVWGADDPTFPLALAEDMVRQFANARLVAVDKAKLLVYEERPQQVLGAVLPFLAGRG